MDIRKRKIKGIFVLSVLIILCLFTATILTMFIPQKSADAIVNSSPVVEVGELLKSSYESDSNGENPFNKENLKKLYEKLTGETGANFSAVKSLGTKTSADFRSKNGNSDIVLTLGKLKWTATYLTTHRDTGDIILDLWLCDNDSGGKTTWNTGINTNTGSYPSNMYGTSKIRAVDLNNGGKYWKSNGELTDVHEKSQSHRYSIFTHENATGSITDYIVKPEKVEYQEKENAKDYGFSNSYNNDAYGAVNGANFGTYDYSSNKNDYGYNDWKYDYLWLPSIAELGLGNGSGIWKVSTEQKKSSGEYYWLRSAVENNHGYVYVMANGGDRLSWPVSATYTWYTRPALHLNLSKAASVIEEPTDISIDYAGKQFTMDDVPAEKKTWYDSSSIDLTYPSGMTDVGTYRVKTTVKPELQAEKVKFDGIPDTSKGETDYIRYFDFVITEKTLRADFNKTASPPTVKAVEEDLAEKDKSLADSILKIQYTDDKGNISFDTPSKVGTYTAKVIFNSSVTESKNYKLDKTYTDTIKIDPQVVVMPEIEPEEGATLWYTYNGKEQYYIITYNSSQMDIEITDEYVGKFDWDGENIIVKNAGEYKDALKLTLKNAYNSVTGEGLNVWNATSKDSQPKYLSFTVNKAEIKVDVYTPDNKSSAVLNGVIGNSSLDVMVELNNRPVESINLTLTAQATSGSSGTTNISSFNINSLTTTASLDISTFKSVRTYVLDVTTDSENYAVKMSRTVTLSMKRVDNPNLIWLLRDTNGIPYEVEVDPSKKDVVFDEAKLVYNGKAYTIEVSEPSGYSVKGGLETVLKGTTSKLSEIKDAGTYVTTVKLVKNGETTETAYTIEWTVDKALLDLSAVKWLTLIHISEPTRLG
ncbi:MAG: hypothetical protein K2I78_04060, partial [Clostridia bacterium]|nr:hypothetical protein [Clostridia bacterium]